MIRYLLAAHRGKVIAGVIVVAVLTVFAILGIVLPGGHDVSPHAARTRTVPTQPTGTPGSAIRGGEQGSNVLSEPELAQLDAAPTVAPATSPLLPPIPAQQRTQPDLYARRSSPPCSRTGMRG